MRAVGVFLSTVLATIIGVIAGEVADWLLIHLLGFLLPTPVLEWVSDALGTSSTVIIGLLFIAFVMHPIIAALAAGVSAHGLSRLNRGFFGNPRIAGGIGAVLSVCVSLVRAYYHFFVI